MNLQPMRVDVDDLVNLQLRYRFSDHDFHGPVWISLMKAGWTMKNDKISKNRMYFPPSNETYEKSVIPPMSSNQVLEFLDLCAIPNIYGNLQSSSESNQIEGIQQENNPSGYDLAELAQTLRNDALFYMLQYFNTRANACSKKEFVSLYSTKKDLVRLEIAKKPLHSRERDKNASYTAPEQGCHLYLHRKQKAPCSKRKLAEEFSPCIDFDLLSSPSLLSCANMMKEYSVHDIVEIEKQYATHFPEWRYLLSTNHSLLFYGAGSKYELLESFATMELNKEGYTMLLKGFDPQITITGIIDLLVKLFLNGVEPETHASGKDYELSNSSSRKKCGTFFPRRSGSRLLDRVVVVARTIAKLVAATLIPIFIVIHNLESLGERAAQSCLSALVTNSRTPNGVSAIRLVCSIDHVDASHALWDSESFLNFQWIWKEVHTYRPYVRELPLLGDEGLVTKHQKSKIYKKSAKVQQSLRFLDVLGSLPTRTSEIAQILAGLQLEQIINCSTDNKDSSTETWVDFKKFREACKSKYAVSADEELRKLMHELIDHRLIQKKSGSAEYVTIPFNAEKLNEIIAYKR